MLLLTAYIISSMDCSKSDWPSVAFEFTGLGRGGQQVQKTKEVYAKAVETLVELASLQVSIIDTDEHRQQCIDQCIDFLVLLGIRRPSLF